MAPKKSKKSLWFHRALLAGALGFSAPAAHAVLPSYCASPYEIAAHIEACPDNRLFSEAAQECRARFEREVQSVTAQLAGSFAGNQRKSVSAQDSKQTNNGVNLGQTDSGLKLLIQHARQIRRDYEDYVTTIILPGNPGMEMLMAYNIYDMLAQNGCYKENRIQLESHIAWIESKVRELELTDAEANRLHAATNVRIDGLEGRTGVLETTHAVGTGRVPAGSAKPRESTITGKIRNEKLP